MTDYYWIGSVSSDATDPQNWMYFVGPTPTQAAIVPGAGDNLAFANLAGAGLGGPFKENCVINAPMSVNNVRMYASPGPGVPTEMLPNGLPASGWEDLGFLLELNAILTCENFAMCTFDTASAPIGMHNGDYDKDMYTGQAVEIRANATSWPYIGSNTSYLLCTNNFYNNGGEVVNCAVRCGGWYQSGEGIHGFSGNCRIEQMGGYQHIDRMRGNLQGLRIAGAITFDNGGNPGGLTGGAGATHNVDPNARNVSVEDLQILANVSVSAQASYVPTWHANGVNPYIDPTVTENQASVAITGGSKQLAGNNPIFTAPFGTLTLNNCNIDFVSGTFTGYGAIQATDSGIISSSTSFHEVGMCHVNNGALDPLNAFSLIKMKCAADVSLITFVDAAYTAGANELYVDSNLTSTWSRNSVFNSMQDAAGDYAIKNIHLHGGQCYLNGIKCQLLTAHPGSGVLDAAQTNYVYDKYTFNGTENGTHIRIHRATSGVGYECNTSYSGIPTIVCCGIAAGVTTTLSGGATVSTNPVYLEIGDNTLDGLKFAQVVDLTGMNIRSLTHNPTTSASASTEDLIRSAGATFFTQPSTYNITMATSAATGTVQGAYTVRAKVILGTATQVGPVTATCDLVFPGDSRTQLAIGGAPTPMQHLTLSLADSTSSSTPSKIEIYSASDDQIIASGERLYVGNYNMLSKQNQHDDSVWELTGSVENANSATNPHTYSSAAGYKASTGLLTAELADNSQYSGESGTDSFGRFRYWDLVFKFNKNSGSTHYCSYYANPSNSNTVPGFMVQGDASLAIECVSAKEYTQAHYPLNGNLYQWQMFSTRPLAVKQRGNVTNQAFIAQGAGALNAVGDNVGQYIALNTHMDTTTTANATINLPGFNTFFVTTTANWNMNVQMNTQFTTASFGDGPGSVTWPAMATITHLRDLLFSSPQIWNAAMTFVHEDAPTNSSIYGWGFTNGPWTGTTNPVFKSEMISGGQTLWSSDNTLGTTGTLPIIGLGQEGIVRANSATVECLYLYGYNGGASTFNHEQPGGAASTLIIRRNGGIADDHLNYAGESSGTIKLEPSADCASAINLFRPVYNSAIKLGYHDGSVSSGVNACNLALTQDITFSNTLTLNHQDVASTSAALMAQVSGAYKLTVETNLDQNQDSIITTTDLTLKCSGTVAANAANSSLEIENAGTLELTTTTGNIIINAGNTMIQCANLEVYGATHSGVYVAAQQLTSTANAYIGYNPATLSSIGIPTLSGPSFRFRNLTIGSSSSAQLTSTMFLGAGAGVFTNYNTSIIETNTHNGIDYVIRGPSLGSITIGIPLSMAALNSTGIIGTYMAIQPSGSFSVSGTSEVSLKIQSTADTLIVCEGTLGFPATTASAVGHTKQTLYLNNFGATTAITGMVRLSGTGTMELGTADSETYIYSRSFGNANLLASGTTMKARQCNINAAAEHTTHKWLSTTGGLSTVEISHCDIVVSQKLLEIHNTTIGFFIYSGVSASTTDSRELMVMGNSASDYMGDFSIYGITASQTNSLALGHGYMLYFRCLPNWNNFHSIRLKTEDTAAFLISDQFVHGHPGFAPRNWVIETTTNNIIRTLSTRDTYTDYWSMPLSTSNYGASMQAGNCIAMNVNGANRSTMFIGGTAVGGEVEMSSLSAQCRLKAGTAGGEFIHSGGKTYYHMPSATSTFQVMTDWMVPRTGSIVKATWGELNSSHVSSCGIETRTLGGVGASIAAPNGGAVSIPTDCQAFRFVLTLPNDRAGITDFSVVDTAYSDTVIYHEHFTHKLSAGDNTENATLSTTEFAFIGNAAADGNPVFPTSLPPLCSKELKPVKPKYLFTPKQSELTVGKEYILVFGYEDNSNYYVAKWSISGAAGQCIAKLWVVDEGAATDLTPGGQIITLPHSDSRCQFGIDWDPGVDITFITLGDGTSAQWGSAIANDKNSSGQVGWGSRGGAHILSFNVIEQSGLTVRGANIIFQSGISWTAITNGLNLYDCTVNTDLLGAFPTYDTDSDTSIFELTSFLTDDFPSRIENFCQVRKGTILLHSDIVLSGSGKLHLHGCIVKRANGGRWKIDTTGVTYNTEPPVVLASCQLRGIQSTMKVEGKALIVLDDESQNAYLTKIYARKEMRVKRNRVLGLEFNRNITQGFDNFEQDCQMISHNDMAIPGELDYMWMNEQVFEFITPYSYQWKAKLTAYRVDILDSSNITSQIRFTVEEWRTD